jgi:hypothetical protein
MCDLRDYQHRTERYLTCRLGTSEKYVDHEMIAAGHPDLAFELDVVSSQICVRALQSLSRRASSPNWPEYSELDCFACHHSLTSAQDSWRQETGYPGRRPGSTPWNQSRNLVLQNLAEELAPEAAKQLSADMAKLAALVSQADMNRTRSA